MSEMIERIALRLWMQEMQGPGEDEYLRQPPEILRYWRDAARIAIEAMREAPVVTTALFPDPVPGDFVTFAELLWSRMIDAALHPGSEPADAAL